MSLEQELRRALRRKDPPRDLADRVLSRIASGEVSHVEPASAVTGRIARMPMAAHLWRRASLPLAASLLLVFGATFYVQQQQQQRQAREQQAQTEQTAHEVVLALQIASETVSAAQAKVEEMTRYEPRNDY
jgi:preprotein translocase subunit YajC